MYRVIEVAKMLNVSKVTVYKKMSLLKQQLAPYIVDEKNITYVKPKGLELIKDALSYSKESPIVPEIEVLKLQETIRTQEHKIEILERESHYWTQALITDLSHNLEYLEQILSRKNAVLTNRLKTIELLKVQLL